MQPAARPSSRNVRDNARIEVPRGDNQKLSSAFRALQKGQCREAFQMFSAMCKSAPESVQAHLGAGEALLELREPRAALNYLARAAALLPDHAPTYFQMGRGFANVEDIRNAEQCFDLYTKLSVDTAATQAMCGLELLKAGDANSAIARFEKALSKDENLASAWNNLGLAHRYLGQKTDAQAALKMAVNCAPNSVEYLYNLSTVSSKKSASSNLIKLETARHCKKSPWHIACANFAKSKWLEDLGEFESAFRSFEKANAAAAKWAGPSLARTAPELTLWSDAKSSHASDMTPCPIFVVGLPRSGTTLVERLISSKTGATALGERNWLARSQAAQKDDLASAYLSNLPDHLRGATHVVDKMPHNYAHIGQILTRIPGAKVVHVYRDLRAVGWSLYKHFFTQGGATMAYAFRLSDILRTIETYIETMDVWQTCFQGEIVHVSYDTLVLDPAHSTAKLVSLLNLPPQTGASSDVYMSVRTASALQARKPVYTGSNNAWKNYQEFAPEWFETLGHLNDQLRRQFNA